MPTLDLTPIRSTPTFKSHPSKPAPRLSALSSKLLPQHSLRTAKTTTFELALVDHLAEFLEGRDGRTIRSIREASGVVGAEVVGAVGERTFRATGSASAVGKARQLVDAR